MNCNGRVEKTQNVKQARKKLIRMAHINDRASRPQHDYMQLLKTPVPGKIKTDYAQTEPKAQG